MSERKPQHPPVTGERLRQAEEEMSTKPYTFFEALTGFIENEARKACILWGNKLPGGKTCEDFSSEIPILVLGGYRKWDEGIPFAYACRSAARSVINNWKNKASNRLSWAEIDFDTLGKEVSEIEYFVSNTFIIFEPNKAKNQ